MALVVFLKGVNVGGHRAFLPSVLARALAKYDVINVGAAGTLSCESRRADRSCASMRPAVVAALLLGVACQAAALPDPAEATYTIDRRTVTLHGGVFEEPAAPGSAAKATTRLIDRRAVGDLDGDGKPDVAVLLSFSGGGSGTFYYVAALLNLGNGKGEASNVVLLGDRIGLDAIRVDGRRIVIEMLDRKPGEPLAASPGVKVSRTFEVRARTLTEVK